MHALVLAAGLGTRLLPHTRLLPKPLFPIGGRPLLDRIIWDLIRSGCRGIVVNTHYLSGRIEAFIEERRYPVPVRTLHEPDILGTGGAIRNAANAGLLGDGPFLAVNGDILTDIDYGALYRFHLSHPHPATLALVDNSEFNTVTVDVDGSNGSDGSDGSNRSDGSDRVDGFVSGFAGNGKGLTFTGVQALDPEILAFIPGEGFSSSIDAYEKSMKAGKKIRAHIESGFQWEDLGTPQRYRMAAARVMADKAFAEADPKSRRQPPIFCRRLKGDGSNRGWFQLQSMEKAKSMIVADHGVRTVPVGEADEADAFVSIGHHLLEKGIPVPEIGHYDTFSGLVFCEDLGDCHLQQRIKAQKGRDGIIREYREVIQALVRLGIDGAQEFDTRWTFQSPAYDRELILEKECHYFVDAFLNRYLNRKVRYADLKPEFSRIADLTLQYAHPGLIHRDMQSRNIMIFQGKPFFIDFQGARPGPLQYDLASLLPDPYTDLPADIQKSLYDMAIAEYGRRIEFDQEEFHRGYLLCRITRNLQILGAFGFLSRVQGKADFAAYIPAAVRSLQGNLRGITDITGPLPLLEALVESL